MEHIKLLMDLELEKESDLDDIGNCVTKIKAVYQSQLSEKEKVTAINEAA